jgi:hypothetical protein
MPFPLVWQLQLNLRAKISLMFVLTRGIFAAISAIVKAEIQKTNFQDPDPHIENRFSLWKTIEMDAGLIAASLPAFNPRQLVPRSCSQLNNTGTERLRIANYAGLPEEVEEC